MTPFEHRIDLYHIENIAGIIPDMFERPANSVLEGTRVFDVRSFGDSSFVFVIPVILLSRSWLWSFVLVSLLTSPRLRTKFRSLLISL